MASVQRQITLPSSWLRSSYLRFAKNPPLSTERLSPRAILARHDAGIRIPQACLVSDGQRRHFASARFERYQRPDGTWGRRHVHTLSGFLHRRASDGQIDYEEFIRSAQTLGGAQEARECFRRAVFNLLTTNRDDHGRNHAFLYNETDRTWSLTPAYDLNPNVANVLISLTWLGSHEIPARFEQLTRLAEIGGIPARAARTIYEEVEAATLGGWRAAAAYAGVPKKSPVSGRKK